MELHANQMISAYLRFVEQVPALVLKLLEDPSSQEVESILLVTLLMELSASRTENAVAVSVLQAFATLHQLLDQVERIHVESKQEVDSTLVVILLMELSASRIENAVAVSVVLVVASLHQLLDQVEKIHFAVETGTAASDHSALTVNAFQNHNYALVAAVASFAALTIAAHLMSSVVETESV